MKNKFFFKILVFFLFFLNANSQEDIIFNAGQINILNNGNLVKATNGSEVILPDNIIITSEELDYDKIDLILEFNKSITAEDKINNIKLETEKLKYFKNKNILNAYNKTIILIQSNYKINSSDVVYDKKNDLVFSKQPSKITDKYNNKINVNSFTYDVIKKIIKADKIKIEDIENNKYFFENAIFDLNNNRIAGKDVEIKLDEKLFYPKNDPRFKGRSVIITEDSTEIAKGVFTTCAIRSNDKCPPWHIKAEKVEHNKKNKLINYKNAWLKVYDMPVLYFPKFFHPDPTVERQSGFLVPTVSESSSHGISVSVPYFQVISKSRDLTFKPRIFDGKILLQNEYRQANKNSFNQFDFSYFYEDQNNNSNSKNKNHFFANSKINITNGIFDISKLEINIQKVSNDTYLKAYNITSNLINSVTTLTSFIDFASSDENNYLNAQVKVYEDLTKKKSDRYEFIYPYVEYSRLFDDQNDFVNFSYDLTTFQKNFDTNIYETSLINNFNFVSNPIISLNGLRNLVNFQIKNVNKDSKNSSSIKSTTSLFSKIMYEGSVPLVKYHKNGNSYFTPKFSLMYSPNKSKDNKDLDRTINFDNVFGFNRLGLNDSVEGGSSITYGVEYKRLDKNDKDIFSLGFANIQRDQKDPDLPTRSSFAKKSSDIFGSLKYNVFDWLDLQYNFAIDNNIDKSNFDEITSTISVNNFVTSFSFLEDGNSSNNQSYLSNQTKYKFDENRSVSFSGRRNRELDITEFYNLIYEYKNDCLTAGIEYKKDYYSDSDIEPNESLFFTLSIVPFGKINTPSVNK